VVGVLADDTSVLSALRAGARSYLTKDADRDDIARGRRTRREAAAPGGEDQR
jgi:DNA-binding NarL/FixJ family response regulator